MSRKLLIYLTLIWVFADTALAQSPYPPQPSLPFGQSLHSESAPDAMRVFILPGPDGVQMKATTKGILQNGGFEESNAGLPVHWWPAFLPQTEDFVRFGMDQSVFRKGRRSASLEILSNHPSNQIIDYNWVQTITEFESRGVYTLRGYIKTQNVKTTAFAVIQCWNRDLTQLLALSGTDFLFPVTGTRDWTKVQAGITIPSGTAYIMIRVGLRAPDNNGAKVWFDDFKLTKFKSK